MADSGQPPPSKAAAPSRGVQLHGSAVFLKVAVAVAVLLALGSMSVAVAAYVNMQSLQLQVHKLEQAQASGRAVRSAVSSENLKDLIEEVRNIEVEVTELSSTTNTTVEVLKDEIKKMRESIVNKTKGTVMYTLHS